MSDLDDAGRCRATVVCLCAPSWVGREIQEVTARLVKAGAIVLAPLAPTGRENEEALVRRRLEIAEMMLVVNAGGYISDPNALEIAAALRAGVRVEFTDAPYRSELDPIEDQRLLARREIDLPEPERAVASGLVPGGVAVFTRPGGRAGEHVVCRVVEKPGTGAQDLERVGREPVDGFECNEPGPIALEARGASRTAHFEYLGTADPDRQASTAYVRALPRPVLGVTVIYRDEHDRVLLVKPAYREPDWQLPGGACEFAEPAWEAAARESAEELGLQELRPARLLAIDRVGYGPELPGLYELVYDGGLLSPAQIARIRLPAEELAEFAFVPVLRLERYLTPGYLRRVAQARAVLLADGRPVELEDGYPRELRPQASWHPGEAVPEGTAVRQSAVFAFDAADGRVVVQHRVATQGWVLPGGRPEPEEENDLRLTAAREALEKSHVVIDVKRAVYLGYVFSTTDPAYPQGAAQVRYAAPILRYDPIAPDTDPEQDTARAPYRRYMCDIAELGQLLDRGPVGWAQAEAAARAAREELGISVQRPTPSGYRDHGDPIGPDPEPAAGASIGAVR